MGCYNLPPPLKQNRVPEIHKRTTGEGVREPGGGEIDFVFRWCGFRCGGNLSCSAVASDVALRDCFVNVAGKLSPKSRPFTDVEEGWLCLLETSLC